MFRTSMQQSLCTSGGVCLKGGSADIPPLPMPPLPIRGRGPRLPPCGRRDGSWSVLDAGRCAGHSSGAPCVKRRSAPCRWRYVPGGGVKPEPEPEPKPGSGRGKARGRAARGAARCPATRRLAPFAPPRRSRSTEQSFQWTRRANGDGAHPPFTPWPSGAKGAKDHPAKPEFPTAEPFCRGWSRAIYPVQPRGSFPRQLGNAALWLWAAMCVAKTWLITEA